MEIHTTPLEGLKLIALDVRRDARGFFIERFQLERFQQTGLPHEFLQDNHSRSKAGVIRGLHYQYAPAQGKLVGAVSGRIWDVAVDVRPTSQTFGKHYGVELSGDNGLLLWIPGGFAHGFCVLGDEQADVCYKVTAHYNAANEGGIAYNDPDLNIEWPVKNPVISERDQMLPSWKDYAKNPASWGSV